MRRFESHALHRFDGVLAVSENDRATFARLYPDAVRHPIHVIPTGVDTRFFSPAVSDSRTAPLQAAASRRLVFTGSMDWLPNEDAMIFFCREVLPLIRVEEPDVTLSIVGRTPTAAVKALGELPGVHVTGSVDDVRPHVRDAAVSMRAAPDGGGTRLKIFEAMAMGKAVVSTTVGAEGLPVVSGEHVVLADEPRSFSRAVVRLLRDRERRRQLEEAARGLVVARYDWSVVAGELESALDRVVHQVPRTSGSTLGAGVQASAPSAASQSLTAGTDVRVGPEPIRHT